MRGNFGEKGAMQSRKEGEREERRGFCRRGQPRFRSVGGHLSIVTTRLQLEEVRLPIRMIGDRL